MKLGAFLLAAAAAPALSFGFIVPAPSAAPASAVVASPAAFARVPL